MDYSDTLLAATRAKDAFMTSSKQSSCMYCGAKVLPQDDWLPGFPEYDLRTGEFEYPANVYHAQCAPIPGAW